MPRRSPPRRYRRCRRLPLDMPGVACRVLLAEAAAAAICRDFAGFCRCTFITILLSPFSILMRHAAFFAAPPRRRAHAVSPLRHMLRRAMPSPHAAAPRYAAADAACAAASRHVMPLSLAPPLRRRRAPLLRSALPCRRRAVFAMPRRRRPCAASATFSAAAVISMPPPARLFDFIFRLPPLRRQLFAIADISA